MSTRHFTFYLAPRFSMLSLLPMTETLRKANELAGENLYAYTFLGAGPSVEAVNGMSISTQTELPRPNGLSAAVICASYQYRLENAGPVLNWIRRLSRHGVPLGTSDAGAFLVAQAGIEWPAPICVHWQSRLAFEDTHPTYPVSDRLYEFAPARFSSIGATAGFDLMLHILSEHHGRDFARQVSNLMALAQRDDPNVSQRGNLTEFLDRSNHPALAQVLVAMGETRGTKRTIPELAADVGMSQAQLSRLFKRELGVTPIKLYQLSRLRRAQEMIRSTVVSVDAIAEACGFASRSQFSTAYKVQFGQSPGAERRRKSDP